MKPSTEISLICTLGSQPQIVTFALDYLLAKGEPVKEVVVLHLSLPDKRGEEAVNRLQAEFLQQTYRGQPCRFMPIAIRHNSRPLTAIQTTAHAESVRQLIHTLIMDLKQQGRTLYLSVAGGPRMLALMAMSTAMLHCGHQDRVWHMYTEPDFLAQAKAERLLHDDSGNRVWLVEVPMVPWGAYFSPLLGATVSPLEAVTAQTAWLDRAEQKRCRQVWQALTERQQSVLRAFAGGLNSQDTAERLVISVKTVDTHKTKILMECKQAWDLPESRHLSFHFLRDKFSTFLESLS